MVAGHLEERMQMEHLHLEPSRVMMGQCQGNTKCVSQKSLHPQRQRQFPKTTLTIVVPQKKLMRNLKNELPEKYNDIKTTPLEATVGEDAVTDLKFDITD